MRRHRRHYARRIPRDPSGNPREMREIGETLSGWQPAIGQKDMGVIKNEPPAAPRSSGSPRASKRRRPRAPGRGRARA
jgi:hypothetical protein